MTEAAFPTAQKVSAFVLRPHRDGGHVLLIFAHADFPEVPLQIPGGSIESESPEAAALREVAEETGLVEIKLVRKLGVSRWFWPEKQRWIERHVFLLEANNETLDRWTHVVSGDGEDHKLRFDCYWMRPGKDFSLGGGLDEFLTPDLLPELYDSPR